MLEQDEIKLYTAFLNEILDECPINKVYSNSAHANMAKNVIRDLYKENKEWRTALQMLSIYPIQHWTANKRRQIGMDINALLQILEYSDDFFGISDINAINSQKKVLEATDNALDIITNFLEEGDEYLGKDIKVIQAVHGTDYKDVSQYLMKEKYPNAISKTCDIISKDINMCFVPVSNDLKNVDAEIKVAYHDANLLIQLGPTLLDERFRRHSQVDYVDACDQIQKCIYALKTYPFDGEHVYEIMKYSFSGWTEDEIAKRMQKSRTYVHSRYNTGVESLTYLIWGYATQSIVGK